MYNFHIGNVHMYLEALLCNANGHSALITKYEKNEGTVK